MLLLSRRKSEEIHADLSGLIGLLNEGRHDELVELMKQPIIVSVVDVRGNRAQLGFDAVPEIAIHRSEVSEKIQQERGEAA